MESWQQILMAYPILQTVWDGLVIVVPLTALLAYSAIFFISAASQIYAISRKRAVYSKCARQIAAAGLILGWGLLVCSRVWLYYTQGQHAPGSLHNFMLEMSWLLLSIGVLLSSVYYCLWGVLKNMPVLLTTIGMIAAIQNTLTLAAALFTVRLSAALTDPQAAQLALPDLFPNAWDDPLVSAACYTIPLMFALAGAIAAIWLILRRKKDDYGRDYYSTFVPWCCRWARNSWVLLWLLLCISSGIQVYQQMQANIWQAEEWIYEGARILLWLLPPLLWTVVIRARVPLRASWAAWLALIIAALFTIPYYLELSLIQ